MVFDASMAVFILDFAFTQGVFPKPPDFASLGSFDIAFFAGHSQFTLFLLTVLAVLVLVGFAVLSRRVRAFWARVRQGLTILRDRRRYFREVWLVQLGGWCFRFTAFWFLLDAFGVGGSVRNVLLVLGVNAVAALVPFTPGGAGVQQAFLVKVFAGTASGATVAAYSVGQQIAIGAFTLARRVRPAGARLPLPVLQGRDRRGQGRSRRRRRGLLQALTRLAHERDRLGEDDRHHRADLLGLLGRRALDVDAVDRRDRHVDRELDRVVGPGQALLTLHLVGELRHAALELLWVAEHSSETFHGTMVAMAPIADGAGVRLSYTERGDGAAVLLVHGLASDAAAMAPLAPSSPGRGARVIAYDRRGYGASGAPEPYGGTTVEEQAEDAAALLERRRRARRRSSWATGSAA